jgi:hypothetical protein
MLSTVNTNHGRVNTPLLIVGVTDHLNLLRLSRLEAGVPRLISTGWMRADEVRRDVVRHDVPVLRRERFQELVSGPRGEAIPSKHLLE